MSNFDEAKKATEELFANDIVNNSTTLDAKNQVIVDNSSQKKENITTELIIAVEAYMNGEKESEDKLYNLVEEGVISPDEYSFILKIHGHTHRSNKWKKEWQAKNKIADNLRCFAAIVIVFGSMLCTLCYVILEYGTPFGLLFFLLWIWAFYYCIEGDK